MAQRKVALVLNGGPGSGKGTDAKVIVREEGFTQFEMGPYLMDLRKRDRALDQVMVKTTDIGLYVPDRQMVPILQEKLKLGFPSRAVVDGVTRTACQAKLVLEALLEDGFRVVTVNLYIPVERNDVFHTRMEFRSRPGETLEVRERRIEEYRRWDSEVVDFMRAWPHHFYREIDGTLEHPLRVAAIKAILAGAPGSRPVNPEAPAMVPRSGWSASPGMVCSDH